MKKAKVRWLVGLVWLGAAFSWSACNTLGAPLFQGMEEQTDEVEVQPAPLAEKIDSVAVSTATAVATEAVEVEEDSLGALAHKVLVMPFKDKSKYKGPWNIQAEMAAGLGDSLSRYKYLRPVPIDSVLVRLKGKELIGHFKDAQALHIGRELDVDWVILGEIEDLSMKRFRATVPLGGYRSYKGYSTVTLRVYKLIDSRPAGEVRREIEKDTKRTGITNPAASVPLDREYYFLGEAEWGTDAFHETLVGQAVGECLGKLSLGLVELIRPPKEFIVSEPMIVAVVGKEQAYINVGKEDGVQNGDKYGVWDHGRELRDPETNTILGHALPQRVGVVQVEQVLHDHLSLVRVLEGGGEIIEENRIRAE